ncbi:hypothetical protein N8612_02275 [Verrucomicrobia bacterium]|jgi:hypothetical protein|nr:hypothetical protein [Verrucomicrobiota bacterium]
MTGNRQLRSHTQRTVVMLSFSEFGYELQRIRLFSTAHHQKELRLEQFIVDRETLKSFAPETESSVA